ncbi:hypothetical protein [Glycomyces dulcitolivorans]|uniref:hypothetical protein n=1 Tax=Glycomyces dulcitolivorans TaxID=2200759 RepID=UPI000DD41D44|nr:hypothetical protein [Glycomyces dulcitolivorans]
MRALKHRVVVIGERRRELDLRALADLLAAAAEHEPEDRDGVTEPWTIQRASRRDGVGSRTRPRRKDR